MIFLANILTILTCSVFKARYHTDKIYAMKFQTNQRKILYKFQKKGKSDFDISAWCGWIPNFRLNILWIMQFVLPGKKLHCRNCKERRLNIEHKTEQLVKKPPKCYYCKNCLQFFCYNPNIFSFSFPFYVTVWCFCSVVTELIALLCCACSCELLYRCHACFSTSVSSSM